MEYVERSFFVSFEGHTFSDFTVKLTFHLLVS